MCSVKRIQFHLIGHPEPGLRFYRDLTSDMALFGSGRDSGSVNEFDLRVFGKDPTGGMELKSIVDELPTTGNTEPTELLHAPTALLR